MSESLDVLRDRALWLAGDAAGDLKALELAFVRNVLATRLNHGLLPAAKQQSWLRSIYDRAVLQGGRT